MVRIDKRVHMNGGRMIEIGHAAEIFDSSVDKDEGRYCGQRRGGEQAIEETGQRMCFAKSDVGIHDEYWFVETQLADSAVDCSGVAEIPLHSKDATRDASFFREVERV